MKMRDSSFQYHKSEGIGELYSEIEICAQPQNIWMVLTDFEEYPLWNPFIRSIHGIIREGTILDVHLQPPGGMGIHMKPVLLTITSYQELRWKGKFLVRGLLDGEHVFEIRDQGNGTCLFIQREYFSGILLPLLDKLMDSTGRGFYAMNEALKTRVEQLRKIYVKSL